MKINRFMFIHLALNNLGMNFVRKMNVFGKKSKMIYMCAVSGRPHLYLLLFWRAPAGEGSLGLTIEFVPILKQMRSISEYKSPVQLYCFLIKFEILWKECSSYLDICDFISSTSSWTFIASWFCNRSFQFPCKFKYNQVRF